MQSSDLNPDKHNIWNHYVHLFSIKISQCTRKHEMSWNLIWKKPDTVIPKFDTIPTIYMTLPKTNCEISFSELLDADPSGRAV